MRNMSFMLTKEQMYDHTKDVTRRIGWRFLEPGMKVMACEKCQGRNNGEPLIRIGPILILSIRWEPLNAITQEECRREGFPDIRPNMFVDMFVRHMKCVEVKRVNRIEFRHLYKPRKMP